MNKTEAEKRARELWGPSGDVARRSDGNRNRRFVVGSHEPELVGGPTIFRARGAGNSWEAAFANAEVENRDVSPDKKLPTMRELQTMALVQASLHRKRRAMSVVEKPLL